MNERTPAAFPRQEEPLLQFGRSGRQEGVCLRHQRPEAEETQHENGETFISAYSSQTQGRFTQCETMGWMMDAAAPNTTMVRQ